jgi:hypothetical protein
MFCAEKVGVDESMSKKERFFVVKLMSVETPACIVTDYDTSSSGGVTDITVRIRVKSSELDKIEEMWYNTKHE